MAINLWILFMCLSICVGIIFGNCEDMKDEQREGYCKEVAGDHYPSNSASDYILPHLLNL